MDALAVPTRSAPPLHIGARHVSTLAEQAAFFAPRASLLLTTTPSSACSRSLRSGHVSALSS
jgi:hypothetical protein